MVEPYDKETLRAELKELGFDVVRFTRIEGAAPGGAALRRWLEAGMHADMGWLERNAQKRCNPELVLEGAMTVVSLGVNYLPAEAPAGAARWARYSRYKDYHDTMTPALQRAGALLELRLGVASTDYRYYVDTGPVLERAWSARAGVGFVGKSGMLISREFGNWLFLGAILLRAPLVSDGPLTVRAGAGEPGALCGKCTLCMQACPTAALTAPGVLDARRCISYLTIENKGGIPLEFRAAIGDRIYGCDICAEVCPWNRFAQESKAMILERNDAFVGLELGRILNLDTKAFAEAFRGTAIKRIKRGGLLRNACIVAGNTGGVELLPRLEALVQDCTESELLREHAAWAIQAIEERLG